MRSAFRALALLLIAAQSSTAYPINGSTYQPRPYTIDVDPAFIERTLSKVSQFSPTLDIDQPAWFDGPPVANVTAIADFWQNDFDWFEYQNQLNANFSHYITTVPPPGGSYNRTLDIHFIHQVSSRSDAIPLLMLHGWPSTSLEWAEVIPSLVNPPNDSVPAFNIVAPDLPGYGFSPAPSAPGLGKEEHATVFASLMAQLGYERYAIYSTDLGFSIAQGMVPAYSSNIINHVSDFYLAFPNATDTERYAANQTTPEETAYLSSINAFFANHSAYAEIHSTLPLSLAHALNDSPVGFLAWMWQLVYTVNDVLETPYQLITRALLLFIPGVYGNIRSYKELYGVSLPNPNFLMTQD